MNNTEENAMTTLKDVVMSYDGLEVSDKRKELGIELTELIIIVKQLLNDLAPNGELFDLNALDDYSNLYSGALSESAYLTGLYEDVLVLKELLGIYFSKIMPAVYENNNE